MARWFPAGAIFSFANDLSSYVTQLSEPLFKDQKPDEAWNPCVGQIIENAKHISKFLGRENIEIQADRVHGCLKSGTREELKNSLNELPARIQDELGLCEFVHIEDLSRYHNPNLFGRLVTEVFPDAQYDIEESGNCYAFGLYTATVFHLMRVMEVCLKKLAKELDMPDPVKDAERNWGRMLERIGEGIGKVPSNKKDFYLGIHAMLTAVKTAWRNPVMHVEGTYTPERADNIFQSVKSFVREFAEGIALHEG